MSAPVTPPIDPMLAKAVAAVPDHDAVEGGLLYEPKWDGFRAIVYFDGTEVQIGSRGSKMLTRYFPDLVAALAEQLPAPCVIDGEIVVRSAGPKGERLDWEALSQRIHPADSRVVKLAAETPASFIAFDLLALGDESTMSEPLEVRRSKLESLFEHITPPLHLTRTTRDVTVARRWLDEFEGAGLDGVVAKPLASVYTPGKRVMLKIKHVRSADVVLVGYRVHKSGSGVGSLLVGLFDGDDLRSVGGVSAFTDARRLELVDELAPLVRRDDAGDPVLGASDRNRFSTNRDVSFVQLEPSRVLEVKYDQMEGARFRHTAQFLRWRPDRDPASCTFDQLEVPHAYDLDDVLG